MPQSPFGPLSGHQGLLQENRSTNKANHMNSKNNHMIGKEHHRASKEQYWVQDRSVAHRVYPAGFHLPAIHFCGASMAEAWNMGDLNGTGCDKPPCKKARVVPPIHTGVAVRCFGHNCPLTSHSSSVFFSKGAHGVGIL